MSAYRKIYSDKPEYCRLAYGIFLLLMHNLQVEKRSNNGLQ